jgi:hypothetical protein
VVNVVEPKPWQAEHIPWLIERPRAMLAWKPGVGKTLPLVRAWEAVRKDGPLLVLCLNTAKENWRREIIRFSLDPAFPPKIQIPTGENTNGTQLDPSADAVIINYDKLLNARLANDLCQKRWGAIIPDEAHALKTRDSKRTMRFYGNPRKPSLRPLVRSTDRVWLSTGTPMPNHPGELFTHCVNLWPEHMQYSGHTMEYWEFEAAFCQIQQTAYGPVVRGGRNLRELKERLAPVVSVINKKVLKLPPLTIDSWALDAETYCFKPAPPDIPGLLGTLMETYGHVKDVDLFSSDMLDAYLGCIQNAMTQMPTVRRETAQLKAIYVGLLAVEEIDEDGEKTIIFAHHREALATLEKILKRFSPAVITGDTPQAKRQAEIDRFNTDPKCKVFIGQIQAAGASINLQAATKVIFVEASWVPGENEQAYGRAHRMGQENPVWVRFAYLPNSIDECVMAALARKAVMIAEVFGT